METFLPLVEFEQAVRDFDKVQKKEQVQYQ